MTKERRVYITIDEECQLQISIDGNETSEIYLPTITLRYATVSSFIPPVTWHVNIIGEVPQCLFDIVSLQSIRFKESMSETRLEYNLNNLTHLTSLSFQSYQRKTRFVTFPLSLKELDIDYEREDLDEKRPKEIIQEGREATLASLTNLTSIKLNHYNVPDITFPTSIISINLRNSLISKLSLVDTHYLTSINIDNCPLCSLTIPPSVISVKLMNCSVLTNLHVEADPTQCHFEIKNCPTITLN